MSAGQAFEAKHYMMRKSKDGVIMSFVVHPDDVTPELQCLPIGARVMIGWAEIEDKKPVEVEPIEVKGPLTRTKKEAPAAREHSPRAGRVNDEPAKPSHERKLAERVAILCNDWRFRKYLTDTGYGAIPTAAVADNVLKMRLGIESKTELNDDAPNFNAEAAANAKLLVMTFDSHLLSEKYADVEHR